MTRLVARGTALLLVAPFLTLASALARQHVHEADHGHAVAHSHFSPHDAGHLLTNDVTEIEHGDDEHVVWLATAILYEAPAQLAPAMVATPLDGALAPLTPRWTVIEVDDTAPPHGPPKRSDLLRGPPFLV